MGKSGKGVIPIILVMVGLATAVIVGMWITMDSEPRPLGPVDGIDLSAVDTGRVAVGDVAPDFSLVNYEGTVTTLSDFRGEKNVVLQFYRGHW